MGDIVCESGEAKGAAENAAAGAAENAAGGDAAAKTRGHRYV
jgi:hypothetical protein